MVALHLTIRVEEFEPISPHVRRLEQVLEDDPSGLYRLWAPIAERSVDRNFARGGSAEGPWAPLAELTVAHKGHDRPLEESGRLRKSIRADVTRAGVEVGPPEDGSIVYAAIQQFGGTAGPGPGKVAAVELLDGDLAFFSGSVEIPARPYNLMDEQGIDELEDEAVRYVQEQWGGGGLVVG